MNKKGIKKGLIPFCAGILLLGWSAMSCNQTPKTDVTLKDYGSEPTVLNIDAYTTTNSNFRTVLWTGTNLQTTLMSIPVGGDVGLELHATVDQFLRIEDGTAQVLMGDTETSLTFVKTAEKDFAIFVPAGKWHNIINTGNKPLKLYSIYSPVQHPHGAIHKTQEEAEEAEHHHHLFNNNENFMTKELIQLPYANNALEPVISKQTIEFHHGKHLQAYVNNLKGLIQGTPFETADLETIVTESDGAIFNNAGQILNHNMYFTQFTPKGGGNPSGKLAQAINAAWGSFENFQKEFETAGVGLFGSGWVWLAADKDGKLSILKETNAGNPLTKGLKPLLTFDVWEHAYYLDFQNRRADQLKSLWSIVDWKIIENRY
jgi:Fe-Mn family superoxide dismutase